MQVILKYELQNFQALYEILKEIIEEGIIISSVMTNKAHNDKHGDYLEAIIVGISSEELMGQIEEQGYEA